MLEYTKKHKKSYIHLYMYLLNGSIIRSFLKLFSVMYQGVIYVIQQFGHCIAMSWYLVKLTELGTSWWGGMAIQ